jgi:biopolymer transport protein ExbD
MAQQRRFYDVWIVESNTVYREVPFTVVSDWVQEGRLLEDDKVRPSGTAEWFRVGGRHEFAPYLPKPDPVRAEDQAEALEAVQVDFGWRKRQFDEDDDVDMIPLIDVSMVLLVFFMLTATGVGASAFIKTPEAETGNVVNDPEGVWLAIDLDSDGTPVYSVGQGDRPAAEESKNLNTKQDALYRLRELLAKQRDPVDVTINARPDVPAGEVRTLCAAMEEQDALRRKILHKYIGVSEKKP